LVTDKCTAKAIIITAKLFRQDGNEVRRQMNRLAVETFLQRSGETFLVGRVV
jgi:hypothetical protein